MIGLGALILLAVVATATLSGIFGMAGGLILMGVYLAILPVSHAMILHGTTQVASNGFRCFLLRKHIYWRGVGLYTLGAVTSLAIFWSAKIQLEKNYIYILLGLLPLVQLRLRPSFMRPAQSALCGLIVTSAHLTAGVSGPILDIFFLDGKLTRHQVIATKAITQTFAHCLKILYFGVAIASDEIDLPTWFYPMVILGAFLGTSIGRQILDRITDKSFLRWSRALVTCICLVFLVRGIVGWLQ